MMTKIKPRQTVATWRLDTKYRPDLHDSRKPDCRRTDDIASECVEYNYEEESQ
jgi:hypothetical protein